MAELPLGIRLGCIIILVLIANREYRNTVDNVGNLSWTSIILGIAATFLIAAVAGYGYHDVMVEIIHGPKG